MRFLRVPAALALGAGSGLVLVALIYSLSGPSDHAWRAWDCGTSFLIVGCLLIAGVSARTRRPN